MRIRKIHRRDTVAKIMCTRYPLDCTERNRHLFLMTTALNLVTCSKYGFFIQNKMRVLYPKQAKKGQTNR